MKKMIKWYFTVFFSLCFVANTIAQNDEENWEEIHSENNVVFLVQHNASRITKTVNTVLKVKNLNEHKVFVQFTPIFYCNGEAGEAITKDQESTYLSFGEAGNTSLHAFQVCRVGNVPVIKINELVVHQTNELDAAKHVKH